MPLRTDDGSWTLLHPVHGEACHSRAGAWEEALERHARACGLDRAAPGGSVRLLDVGTGPGWNLAAALHLVAARGARLEAVGLERDPEVLRAGIALGARPEAAAGPWAAAHGEVLVALGRALADPAAAARAGVPLGRGRLRLLLGDARATIALLPAEERFDAVFLDPFSPAREPELWAEPFLAALAARLAPGGSLSTYSAAFRVRLGLARAGLAVGRGARVGTKREGTVAGRGRGLEPLAAKVRRRLEREAGAGTVPGGGE